MKSSLGKLRKLAALHKADKEKRDHQPPAHLDELDQATQDMQDMRNCYDSLLSAAAATTNSAYEFSESLEEMGKCLLEKTALNVEGESGSVLLMLGRLQLELQKLVDKYRSHIILTITTPSESLLGELRKVEEMKLQCDEKRGVYQHILSNQREKGKVKSGKGESFSQQLQEAREEYDEVARLCVFRAKSLKQGQYLSLLTQAARHHAAQLNFFRKGLKSLEAVDPQIKLVAEKQHIDYQLGGLDDGEDVEGGSVKSYETNDDGELSFVCRENKQGLDNVHTSKISMEVDVPYAQTSKFEEAELNLSKIHGGQPFGRQPRASYHSAPLFPEKFDQAERVKEMKPPVRKFHTYVLPTPVDVSSASRTTSILPNSSSTTPTGSIQNPRNSSSVNTEKRASYFGDDNLSSTTNLKAQSIVKESSSSINPSIQLPAPLGAGHSQPQCVTHNELDSTKYKRQAFSGPMTSKPWSSKSSLSTSGPIASTEPPQLGSALLSRIPLPHLSSSPTVSRSASPPPVSSPRISELHELPRPPGSLASKPASSSGVMGHSGPLVFRSQELSAANKNSLASSSATPLPAPPSSITRSFSIPSGNQRAMAIHVAKLLESPQIPDKAEEVTSPPLTPISLSKTNLLLSVTEAVPESGQIRDAGVS